MNTSFWKLTNVTGGVTKTFAAWNIEEASVEKTHRSQAIGTLTFRQTKAFDATLDFSVGDIIRVTRGGAGWFYGRVQRASPSGSGRDEGIQYEIADPWWWLENLVFEQDWNIATDPNSPTSALVAAARARVILGLDADGSTRVLTGAGCTAIANYAIARGAPFSLAETYTGIEIPSMELIDMTCAEIIRLFIKWTPDICTAWDYSGTTPALRFKRRAAQTAKSRAITTGVASDITPRNDLLVPGVVIKFEKENQLNELTWRTITTQQSGSDTFGTIKLTVALGGSSQSTMTQSVTTADIEPEDLTWWTGKYPWLANATGPDGTGVPTFSNGAVSPSATKEITDGATPPWLAAQTARVTVTAKVSYKLVNADNGTEVVKRDHTITVQVNGTTLTTGIYQRTLSSTPGESTPSGVAAGIYAALNVLHYEGQFVQVAEEVAGDFSPGDLLNLTGGRAEWSSMNAQVQEVIETPAQGQTVIRFGPPGHLSPQDFIELERMNRNRRPSYKIQERIDGIAASLGGAVEGPRLAPNDSPLPLDMGESEKVIAQVTGGNTKKIALRISDIVAGAGASAEIKLREIDYCDDTMPSTPKAKILVLSSAPYGHTA